MKNININVKSWYAAFNRWKSHKFSMWPNMNNSLQTEKKSYRIIRRQFLVGCKSQVATH